jgi:transposase
MTPVTTAEKSVFMAMELSNKNWKLAFSNSERIRHINVVAGDQRGLRLAIERSKEKFGLARDCEVYSCYEAGRDGFWIHRCLTEMGVKNMVVDPASIEINRRRRRVKTDRLDAESLVRMLMRYVLHNEKTVWRVVVVPLEADEDERRVHREYKRLSCERTGHLNRIRSLLVLYGVHSRKIAAMDNSKLLDWRGRQLPAALQEELRREQDRLDLLDEQIKALDARLRKAVKDPKSVVEQKSAKLAKLKGIGVHGASVLSREFFGWRKFRNRREVGAMAGLTGTAYASGDKSIEQGISKAGNKRVRHTMIEMAWMWIRYQQRSELTKWFMRRFGEGGKRMRRVGIVAVARKLLVALWKYVEFDEIPAGAMMSA